MTRSLDRRQLLTAIGAGLLASLSGCGTVPGHDAGKGSAHHSPSPASGSPSRRMFSQPDLTLAAMPSTPIERLPATANHHVALTIDDGVSSEVVGGYARLCADTGLRLTFFANGVYQSWTENKAALAPLVESGQVVIGNHTWSHPNLTRLGSSAVAEQLRRNERHFQNLFGVGLRPFFRPPYGYTNAAVLRVARNLGYPTPVLWYGNLGDDQIITPAKIMANAHRWLNDRAVVIGHANHPAVTHVYDQLVTLIHDRHLQPITLRDAFRPLS